LDSDKLILVQLAYYANARWGSCSKSATNPVCWVRYYGHPSTAQAAAL